MAHHHFPSFSYQYGRLDCRFGSLGVLPRLSFCLAGTVGCEASVESRLDPEALSKSLLPWVWILDFSSLIPKKKLKTLKTVVSFFFQGRNFDVRFFFNTVKRENIIHKRVQWFLGTASDCGYDFAVGHNYHSVVIQCHMHIIHDVPQKKMRIQKAFATSGRTHT